MTVMPQLERQLARAARRRRRRSVRAVAIAAAVTFAVAAVLLVPVLIDDNSSGPAPETRSAPAAPRQANPPLEDLLGVFRRPRTPHDKANFTLADLEATHDRQPGETPADSRRVDLRDGPVYLWRMKDGVCTSFGSCMKTGQLAHLRVAIGISGHAASAGRPRKLVLDALVVDGINAIQIGSKHGIQFVQPVKDNVLRVDLTRFSPHATRILWREHGVWHRQKLPSLP